MIRTFAALAAVLTVGAVQAADMNMDMSGHEHHMMAGDHSDRKSTRLNSSHPSSSRMPSSA